MNPNRGLPEGSARCMRLPVAPPRKCGCRAALCRPHGARQWPCLCAPSCCRHPPSCQRGPCSGNHEGCQAAGPLASLRCPATAIKRVYRSRPQWQVARGAGRAQQGCLGGPGHFLWFSFSGRGDGGRCGRCAVPCCAAGSPAQRKDWFRDRGGWVAEDGGQVQHKAQENGTPA